jgi:prophage regulatory protein
MGEVLSAGDLIPIEEVQAKTNLGASTIYKWMAADKFPLGVQLSPRCVRWLRGEVDAWIQEAAQGKRLQLRRPDPLPEASAGPIQDGVEQPRRGRGRPRKVTNVT